MGCLEHPHYGAKKKEPKQQELRPPPLQRQSPQWRQSGKGTQRLLNYCRGDACHRGPRSGEYGRPAQILEHSGPDSNPITRIVSEVVHVNLSPEELSALNEAEKLSAEPMPIERHRANGNGGLNEDTEGRLK
jgi:hypothetical protein